MTISSDYKQTFSMIFQPLSQREAAMNITSVPLLVILVVVLAQHASIIMSSGGISDGGHHGTG